MPRAHRVHHQAAPSHHEDWREINRSIRDLEGQLVSVRMPGTGNQRHDIVVKHDLGRVPEVVALLMTHPADGESPFFVWEIVSGRTKSRIVLRSDSIHAGDVADVRIA